MANPSNLPPYWLEQEIRCKQCDKMIAKQYPYAVNYEKGVEDGKKPVLINNKNTMLELKCPRCKTLNEVVV